MLLSFVFAAAPAAGQTQITWQQNRSAYWDNRFNWDTQQIPTASDIVFIGGYPPLFPEAYPLCVIKNYDAAAYQMSIGGDTTTDTRGQAGTLIVDQGGTLQVGSTGNIGGVMLAFFPGTRGTLDVWAGGQMTVIGSIDFGGSASSAISTPQHGAIDVSGAGSLLSTSYIFMQLGSHTISVSDGGRLATGSISTDPGPGFIPSSVDLLLAGTSGRRGVLATKYLNMGGNNSATGGNIYAPLTLTFDGGVFEAQADQTEIFQNFQASQVIFNSGGAFFDTNGKSIGTNVPMSGAGGLTKMGLGTLTLRGANTYAGGTNVLQGYLVISGNGASISHTNADVNISSGGYLQVVNNGTANVQDIINSDGLVQVNSGGVIDARDLSVTGAGSFEVGPNGTLNGRNAFNDSNAGLVVSGPGAQLNLSGVATVDRGMITVANGAVADIHEIRMQNSGSQVARLEINGGANGAGVLKAAMVHAPGGNSEAAFNGGKLQLTDDAWQLFAGVDSLTLESGGGVIDTQDHTAYVNTGFSGSGLLTKEGSGRLYLMGNNQMGGAVVNNGSLLLYSATVDAPSVQVNSGAVLGGTGTITGDVNVASGGTLQVDNGGAMTVRDVTLANGGQVLVQGGGTLTGRNAQVDGAIAANGAGTQLNLSSANLGFGALDVVDGAVANIGDVVVGGFDGAYANLSLVGGASGAGVLKTGQVHATGAGATSFVNFSGGTLQLTGNQSSLFQGVTSVRVYPTGGTIDTQGFNVATSANFTTSPGSTLTKTGTGELALSGYGGNFYVAEGTLLVNSMVNGDFGVDSVTVGNGATLGGYGIINGDLTFNTGSYLLFSPTTHLTVDGLVSFGSGFGVDNLLGLDSSIDFGTYTLIDGTSTHFAAAGLDNWGYANRYDLGNGKYAWFEQGSLDLRVASAPEPTTTAALLGLGAAGAIGAWRKRRRKEKMPA